jgi:hypothetical protein
MAFTAGLASVFAGTGHRDWTTLLPQLRRDAPTEPHAAGMLAAIMMGKSGAPVQTDFKAAAALYCQAIHGWMTPQHNVRGARADTLRVMENCMNNMSVLIEAGAVAPGESLFDECIAALRLVVRECGSAEALTAKPADPAEGGPGAALTALLVLAASAMLYNDTDKALQYCRQAVSTYETAYRAGNCKAAARLLLDATVKNLRLILLPDTPGLTDLEQLMARASLMEPARAETPPGAAGGRAAPAARPACAGCGTTDAVLRKCKGSCRGANADGRFCSTECAQRSWTAHKKKTGCHKLTKEGAAQGATAASSPGRAATQAAAAAGSSGATAAQTRAMQTVIFKAFVYDSHCHQAHFEGPVEVDADLAVAQRDAEADQRLISYCVGKSTQAVLKLQPWRCVGCGGAAANVTSSSCAFLHLPLPAGPTVFAVATPHCRNDSPCGARGCSSRRRYCRLRPRSRLGFRTFQSSPRSTTDG